MILLLLTTPPLLCTARSYVNRKETIEPLRVFRDHKETKRNKFTNPTTAQNTWETKIKSIYF